MIGAVKADAWGRPAETLSRWPRCQEVSVSGITPGWACCACRTFNGEKREQCRACLHRRCDRKRAAPGRVATGTIANMVTAGEVKELIKAKDAEMAALAQSYANFAPTWVNRDSKSFLDWTQDWTALKARYASAKGGWVLKMRAAISDSAIAVGPWDDVVKSLQQAYPGWLNRSDEPIPITKGDLSELFARMQAAGGSVVPHYVPQPKKGDDTDLNAMIAIEKLPIPGEAGFPWWVYAGTGFVVLGVGYIALSPYLPRLTAAGSAARGAWSGSKTDPELPKKDPELPKTDPEVLPAAP